ncbi:hypothetical protein [Mesorhizobium sp. M1378]|uniref:hypothetical protein n=1 Tax=Mesorhizobium sp. M1378 TaxID=2957092 RepID=UPI003338277D
MIWLRPHIEKIRSLVETDTGECLTYAALECRLAIELVCYDRLKVAHDYISHDDLKKWQPKDVVKKLIQDVDANIASTFTLSISTRPADETADEMTQADFDRYDYVPVGTQIGFDANKIGKLWNALSSFLHVTAPRSARHSVEAYGNPEAIGRKISEVVGELERLSSGTLISSGVGETVNFECNCGTLNKRRAALLKPGQTINCMNPECTERWDAVFEGGSINFQRRTIAVNCRRCGHPSVIAERLALELPLNTMAYFICEQTACQEKNPVMWRLMQAAPDNAAPQK